MWLPSIVFKSTSLIAGRDVLLLYLILLTAKTIIKAIAIMVTATSAVKSKISICNIVRSTISITSLS